MSISKFLDPQNDFAFKRIFGTEKNQDILIHFLNDMLELRGRNKIKTVTFLKTSQDPEIASKKQSLVDVLCVDNKKREYIVEMQVARSRGFEKRAQYYAAKAYSRQLDKAEKYHDLKEIIFLAITNFVMFTDKVAYKSDHVILDKETYSHDLKDFYFSFLELPKFKKTIDELDSIVDKWAYFFKHAEETSEEELERLVGSDHVIKQAYEELDRFSWTEVELNTYEQEEKRERDAQAIIDQNLLDIEAAEAKSKANIEAAKAKYVDEGIEQGIEKGREETVHKIALKLLEQGCDIEFVVKATALSKADVVFLKEKVEK